MIIQDRDAGRRVFFDVWRKYARGVELQPLEQLVLAVILEHPEYHAVLGRADSLDREFSPDAGDNPFLHMGMHIAIREQISTDRPPGISARYQILLGKTPDDHRLQHRMMECLGETLWSAKQNRRPPDEVAYLECLGKLG
jgi:hypothetical protein